MLQSRTLMRGLVRGKGWLLLTLWVTGDEEVRLAVVIGSDWSVVIDSVVFVISSVGGVVVYAGSMVTFTWTPRSIPYLSIPHQ